MARHGVRPTRTRSTVLTVHVVLVAATALAVGVRWTGDGSPASAGPACVGPALTLDVGADASVIPWLSRLASSYTSLHRKVQDRCVEVSVRTVTPGQVGQAVTAGDPGAVDAWLPESTATVGLVRMQPHTSALAVPTTSVASSPIVLGLPRDAVTLLAQRLPGRAPALTDLLGMARDPAGWGSLATGEPSWGPVRFSTPDPGRTTLGAGFVVAAVAGLTGVPPRDLGSSGFARVDARNNLLGFTRTLISAPADARQLTDAAGTATTTAQLLRRVGVLAVYEQDVWRYDGGNPAVALQAVYPVGGQLAADFPYVVPNAPWVDAAHRAATGDLRDWLLSAAAQDRLSGFGLRRPDGSAGGELSDRRGVRSDRIAPEPARIPDGYAGAQAAWSLITRPTSTLTVLDVSGSMAERVPGTTRTKLQLAQAAGIAALEFTGPHDSLGLWSFSTRLSGRQDYRQLVSLGPANLRHGSFPNRQAAMTTAYHHLVPRTDTGLHDTVLAAYATASARYRPDAVNTVVVISDGINDDPGSMSLGTLLTRLRQRYDPQRPVHIITLAYGAKADRSSLAAIARATDGLPFAAVDPRHLSDVFIAAVTAYRLHPHGR